MREHCSVIPEIRYLVNVYPANFTTVADLAGRHSRPPRRRETDVRTDRLKICPFYRTSSPTGAAALLQQRKLKANKLENYS